jgi:hypothetical protein
MLKINSKIYQFFNYKLTNALLKSFLSKFIEDKTYLRYLNIYGT